MRRRIEFPADLMTLLVWLPLFIVGLGLVADGALHVFNWLAGSS